MSNSATSPIVLLVQCSDDVEMYVEFLYHEGVTPVVVSNVVDALATAADAHIVVTGIHLAGDMDGIDLVTQLRANEHTRDMPIIVLTASAWHADRERAQKAGCDLFLSKPCLPDDLLRHVRMLLAAGTRRTKKRTASSDIDQEFHGRTHDRRARPNG